MPVAEAVRSWKDEDFLMSLSEEQLSLLPENPAGHVMTDLPGGERDEGIYMSGHWWCSLSIVACNSANC